MFPNNNTVFLLLILLVCGTAATHGNVTTPPQGDFSGVIVHQLPVPSLLQRITRRAVYTALQVENRKPPRGHDSNLITFHRIADFRGLLSRQVFKSTPDE